MKSKVFILFRNGSSQIFEVEAFSVEKRDGALVSITWTRPKPAVRYLDVSEVIAIYDLGPC